MVQLTLYPAALRAPGHSAADHGVVMHEEMKTTQYFKYTRMRPDRARIRDEWIRRAISKPIAEEIQSDYRIRRWAWIPEEKKYLRVILLEDGETIHNAFFDRAFRLKEEKNEN